MLKLELNSGFSRNMNRTLFNNVQKFKGIFLKQILAQLNLRGTYAERSITTLNKLHNHACLNQNHY